MIHHVPLQLQFPFELLSTGVAIVLHFVTVNSFVVNHILLLCKTFTTGVTDPWFLSCMNSSVQLQLAFTYKPCSKEYIINLTIRILVHIRSFLFTSSHKTHRHKVCLLWDVIVFCGLLHLIAWGNSFHICHTCKASLLCAL